MFKNYRPLVDDKFQDDDLYAKPPAAITTAVKKEKLKREKLKIELKEDQINVGKIMMKKKLDDLANLA